MSTENNVVHITKDGYEEMEAQLEHLLDVRRPKVATRLRLALEEGGELIENTEYANAKDEQAMVEGDIERLKSLLSRAKIIEDGGKKKSIVSLNSRVTVKPEDEEESVTYHIVGRVEANPREGKISDESPLGQALMGKKKGDIAEVEAPDGVFTYKIITVK